MVIKSISILGRRTEEVLHHIGTMALFVYGVLLSLSSKGVSPKKLFAQINNIGVNSLSVILLTGSSVGSVMAWQTYNGLHQFKTYQYIGPVVFMGMVRVLGPVLSAIMIAGRSGSAMTAEIGTMQITEQVDALRTLNIDVQQYLIVPRIVATTLILPLLSLFCSLCGFLGSYIVTVWGLKVNSELFISSIQQQVVMGDIIHGLIKAVIFGFLLSLIATYKGFNTRGGAKNVGIATTESVVMSCLTVFITDFIMSSLMP